MSAPLQPNRDVTATFPHQFPPCCPPALQFLPTRWGAVQFFLLAKVKFQRPRPPPNTGFLFRPVECSPCGITKVCLHTALILPFEPLVYPSVLLLPGYPGKKQRAGRPEGDPMARYVPFHLPPQGPARLLLRLQCRTRRSLGPLPLLSHPKLFFLSPGLHGQWLPCGQSSPGRCPLPPKQGLRQWRSRADGSPYKAPSLHLFQYPPGERGLFLLLHPGQLPKFRL